MIFVNCVGRLGNQMFFYSVGRKIQWEYSKIQIEQPITLLSINKCKDRGNGWEDSLKQFSVASYNVSDKNPDEIIDEYGSVFQRKIYILGQMINAIFLKNGSLSYYIALKLINEILFRVGGVSLYPYELNKTNAKVKLKKPWINYRNIFMFGQYENPYFFSDINEVLRKDFTPIELPMESNNELYHKIENSNSVCISIRRGDFLAKGNEIFNVCTVKYFCLAIKKIKQLTKNPVFFVFSDDITWCKDIKKSLFEESDEVFYETGNDAVSEKMRMMYMCKHFIISNSTFSWWAQFLSSNKNKIVISPYKWRNNSSYYALLEDSFIKIEF